MMRQLHSQEKEQFKKLFQQERVENFEDRLKVLEVFLSTEKHVTVDELVDRLQAKGAYISLLVAVQGLTGAPSGTCTTIRSVSWRKSAAETLGR